MSEINSTELIFDNINNINIHNNVSNIDNFKIEDLIVENDGLKTELEILDFKKKHIIDTVKGFSKSEHIEILKIINKYDDIKYTENNNGIFINLNSVPEKLLLEIEKFVSYFLIKKDYLKEEKNKQDKIKKTIKNNIEKKCDLKINEIKMPEKFKEFNYYNEEQNIDQNEMYYQESNFTLPKIN